MPDLGLLSTYLRVRDAYSSVPYTFQQVPSNQFNNRLFIRPPNKLSNFEREWLVVEVPINVSFPMRWGNFHRPPTEKLKDLGRMYSQEIHKLRRGTYESS